MAGVLLAGGGIIAATFGPGLPRAAAQPEEELERIAARDAYTTCTQLAQFPDPQGVDAAIGDVMDRNEIPRRGAERVVGLSVKSSCPQYLPLVQQVVPGFS
jgi:hypothetical protein